jgi:hypothetical protein
MRQTTTAEVRLDEATQQVSVRRGRPTHRFGCPRHPSRAEHVATDVQKRKMALAGAENRENVG